MRKWKDKEVPALRKEGREGVATGKGGCRRQVGGEAGSGTLDAGEGSGPEWTRSRARRSDRQPERFRAGTDLSEQQPSKSTSLWPFKLITLTLTLLTADTSPLIHPPPIT